VGILPNTAIVTEIPAASDAAAEAAAKPGHTLSGVQKKLLAFREEGGFRPCLKSSDPATHIAKFNREDLPTLVRNEHLSLSLGGEILGIGEIANAQLGTLHGIDGIALLVERFDRASNERLRLEDFAQILGKPRGRRFDGKYQSSYEEAASVIDRFSARAKVDLERYFRLVVFNLVIGNADAHLKNFSLLERPEGLRLSPAYDLVNTLIYPYDRETALEIAGQKRSFDVLDRQIVERLGIDIGLAKSAVTRALDQLSDRFANAPALQFPTPLTADDFRIIYRDVVIEQAQRIFT